MQCPACGKVLQEVIAGEIRLDACVSGCGGIWFDQLELKRLDEQHEALGETLLNLPEATAVPANPDEKRQCPRCDGQVMLRWFYSPQRRVNVDHCPNCGGHWLDAGELFAIRALYSNDTEREQAIDRLFTESFGEAVEQMSAARDEGLGRRGLLRRMFGFLLPR